MGSSSCNGIHGWMPACGSRHACCTHACTCLHPACMHTRACTMYTCMHVHAPHMHAFMCVRTCDTCTCIMRVWYARACMHVHAPCPHACTHIILHAATLDEDRTVTALTPVQHDLSLKGVRCFVCGISAMRDRDRDAYSLSYCMGRHVGGTAWCLDGTRASASCSVHLDLCPGTLTSAS